MDKTRIDYDYDKKKSVRRSNNPALQREIDDYNRNEAVEFMRRKKMRNMTPEQKVEQIREDNMYKKQKG